MKIRFTVDSLRFTQADAGWWLLGIDGFRVPGSGFRKVKTFACRQAPTPVSEVGAAAGALFQVLAFRQSKDVFSFQLLVGKITDLGFGFVNGVSGKVLWERAPAAIDRRRSRLPQNQQPIRQSGSKRTI